MVSCCCRLQPRRGPPSRAGPRSCMERGGLRACGVLLREHIVHGWLRAFRVLGMYGAGTSRLVRSDGCVPACLLQYGSHGA